MSTLNESLRDWIEYNLPQFPDLEPVDLVTMGETEDLSPPFLGIMETASEAYTQDGVQLPGVSTYEITCELHTVPTDADNDGTPPETEREYRRQFYDILGDRFAIDWINGRNLWNVFDIRLGGPTTEASDGRRITRFVLSIVAAPI
jgi:hypothetical protein